MANKIKYGLRNVYYATVTAGVYGTPVAMPGAKAISLSAKGDKLEVYADDVLYVSETANNGYEGDLEITDIPKSFITDILGL